MIEKQIFVLCPSKLVTGGAELLHQLVNALVGIGRSAYIAYTPLGIVSTTPAEYRRYQCPVATYVPDTFDAAIIVPEVSTLELFKFKKARHLIWWLSVDNYRGALGTPAGWKQILRRFLCSDIPSPAATTHLFQSAYAKNYVLNRFGCDGKMLSDYIAEDYFFEQAKKIKKKCVAYNPKKGLSYTKKLIKLCPEIEFIRLENMNRFQVRDVLDHCYVYIDFGIHPGKDRIPREAAIRDAIVIVARRGAAAFFEDVRLSDCYKFSDHTSSVEEVKNLIEDIFSNYLLHHDAQKLYRAVITQEFDEFQKQVYDVFGIGNKQLY